MIEFFLHLLLHIPGIEAASGIEYAENRIFLVSDNSNYLYEYHMDNQHLTKHRLMDQYPMEQIKKSEKMDLEAMLSTGDMIYAFSSGSTARRELGFSFHKKKQEVKTIPLDKVYQTMRKKAQIDPKDFNIEAATLYGENWLFLNRGNGPGERHVIFEVRPNSLNGEVQLSNYEITLPKVNGLTFGFSGAAVEDHTLYFLATAEAGNSTYDDGEIGGTIFGIIDLRTMKLQAFEMISKTQKFEGITIYKAEKNKLSFLLCEDNDGASSVAEIFQLDISYPSQH